jgi:phosphoglycerate dehydrogenase-like enzyme
MTDPKIVVAPFADDALLDAVRAGGGEVVDDLATADALVWTSFADPDGLRDLLATGNPRWVQLPLAGVEKFFTAGVITAERVWTCAKTAYGRAVAEHALALMLAAARRIHVHSRAKEWVGAEFDAPEREFAGSSVVVVGTGAIGTELAPMLKPFDVEIVGVNRSGKALGGATRTVTVDRLDEVLPAADYVVIAAALTDETRGLIDEGHLRAMKRDAWLINVARGALVDTEALVAALDDGALGGAALDVTEPEPLPSDHPLWAMDNVIVTPHVANTPAMAVPQLRALVERNVGRFARGETLEGLVDPTTGY